MAVTVKQRKPWLGDALLLLIGLGGAGKSTVGGLLAPLLGRCLIDLDHSFSERFGRIGSFITEHGYDEYKIANSRLSAELVDLLQGPSIIVLSSGFLSPGNRPDILSANKAITASGYSVCLLPSLDIEETTRIIVARQMSRGQSLNTARETEKVRSRFAIYKSAGDMLVVSAAAPHQITSEIASRCA
ncbi:shikimate kinase [Methylorubrum extorquens]|uniref:Shikimate kinase n=1 Tax=Methylorubrum extorquens (strain ATCC 14718 / DSM 1338 / JCM 2805 / NCIMB 9133 / AM1) TaxID=272630 RepID=C5B4D1_METEA|nr:shikimate kinase [Methylorubrum extorquens]ACS43313.1 putative Shikimate kinase [Methylorubrum extorquens AM1]MCP1545594.1 shikimate kinase [Methylorubrum extorquens]MCP1591545.1 shikimate kinase [Methylorubrum extorquens]